MSSSSELHHQRRSSIPTEGVAPPQARLDKKMSQLLHGHDLLDASAHYERKTKIICTLGPSSCSVEQVINLLESGMNVARFNFSHGSHKSHYDVLENVREAMRLSGKSCAIMLDTKGPEIRTGLLPQGKPVTLQAGQTLTILCAADFETFIGDVNTINVDYQNLYNVVSIGSVVKIDDGLIVTRVLSIDSDNKSLVVRVENSAELGQRKGVNLPGTPVDLPSVTDRDKADLLFAAEHQYDLIAASFTRKAEDIQVMRQVMGEKGKNIKIIAKIESQEGLDNFDGILEAADGIMVARGDLGVEIPIQKVWIAQKMMIRKCVVAGKPVITATQMLESMINNPRPTRAEASDVANAVFDGTDCVMLSGETAKGDYPCEAIQTMGSICKTAELALDYSALFLSTVQLTTKPIYRSEVIASSAVKASLDLDSSAIIVLTETGSSARFVSKYKPKAPIILLTCNEVTAKQALVLRGVFPIVVERDNDETLFKIGMEFGKTRGWVKTGDNVVLVSGLQAGVAGATNMMKVVDVE